MIRYRIVLLLSLVALVIIFLVTWPDGKVRVIFCDVGQGDGIIISQGSFQMLLDTGPENDKMLGCLERNLPFWDKTIETVIISHWDKDHYGGLKQVGKHYRLEGMYGSRLPEDKSEQKNYTGNLALGDVVKYGLITLEVLNPGEDWGNENDNSLVGRLSYRDPSTGSGQVSFWMMADVTAQVEQKLVWRGLLRPAEQGFGSLNILKVSHHGSAEATSEELLKMIRPAEAVISVGKNNKFGHPTKAVLDRLSGAGARIRRTDEEGSIIYEL
jgi:competence protein ComEC